MRLIDADRLLEILEREEAYHNDLPQRADGVRDAIMGIISAPTVDAVEVVRCANCIRYHSIDEAWGWCAETPYRMRKKDYCSYGVRKDGGDETD